MIFECVLTEQKDGRQTLRRHSSGPNFRKQKKEDNMKLKTAILQKRSLDRQYEKSTGIILEKMAETAENNADILLRWETPSEK